MTCSVLEEENGARVGRFVETHPDFRVEDASILWQQQLPSAGTPYIPADVAGGRAMTMTPHRTGTDGFFFARLARIGDA